MNIHLLLMYVEKSLEKYRENRDTAKSGNTKKKQGKSSKCQEQHTPHTGTVVQKIPF